MYKIYADDTLIYDSTLEDYKIGKGSISFETDKSGSFTFSIYPDHFFYDNFVRLKTVITVYKSGRIKFRGRILNDVTDYWNNKVITCEGELGFLQDSVIRPFEFTGTPEALFKKFIEEHNSQVDKFKQFKIGTITVVDPNDYVNRSSTDYGNTLSTLTSATTGSALGGHIYITHGDDGTDPIPTIHYLEDFTKVASQKIEFGSNLKNYTKTVKAEDIATAIVPLGTTVASNNQRLTIVDVNNGVDYVYSEAGVALYGWIFKTVVWEDVTLASNLKTKAEEYLESVVNQNITIELNAIDLHLLDRSIESFNVCDYVHVVSEPHNLDAVLLCNKQTIDLLKPENDTIVLGYATATFTGSSNDMASSVSTLGKQVSSIKQDASSIELQVQDLSKGLGQSLRVAADGITITNAEGDVLTINGGQIDASKINTRNLNLTGVITFNELSAGLEEYIDEAYNLAYDNQLPSYIRSTYISSTEIRSPTIKGGIVSGGQFTDLNKTNWIEMGENSNGTIGYLNHYFDNYSSTDPVLVMGFSGTTVNPNWILAPFFNVALDYLLTNETMYAMGKWDFSQATVTGIEGTGGSDVTVTPVWG